MSTFPIVPHLSGYWQDAFDLKQHLHQFLDIDPVRLEQKFATAVQDLAELGRRDFDWEDASKFYRDRVGEAYLFELATWHLTSTDYIGDTLRLIGDRARGRVLDFGGGIGTHAIASALCPAVTHVTYCDINPINYNFVRHRIEQLGLGAKITCCTELDPTATFDTITCFDVMEHLPDPSDRLLQFHQILKAEGTLIINWYFSKGINQEFPFHLDDPKIIDCFFRTLQSNFIEVFHPYFITTRCYQKMP
ncbi:class I SAM-dependent methyltransferase [Chamaesiphon sp.]|uniref:class I SAM-dependent methyltransferase n=1 Tax=Chamaesiphon sp. TaxID=2814140 RepID=UPI00359426DA